MEDPFRIGIGLVASWIPEQIWDPYGGVGAQNLQEAIDSVNITVGGIRFGDFCVFWADEVFGYWGDRYPYDHPERLTQAPNPLHLIPDRVYTLNTYGDGAADAYFHTGTLPDRRQVLMGWYDDQVVALFFDADGEFLEAQERPTGFGPDSVPPGQVYPVVQHRFASAPTRAWQAELGWREGPIRVRFFMHPDRRIYLSDLSRAGVTAYYDPFVYIDREEREKARRSLRAWLDSGNFVLSWMRDYRLDREGNVLST